MLIPSYDGSELELHLAGRRWPNLEGGRQTLHWLRVAIRVLAPFGSVSFRENCLLDWEAAALIRWLDGIARDETGASHLDFYEGTLAFDLLDTLDDVVTLRCHLISLIQTWTLADDIDHKEMLREDNVHQHVDLMLTRNQLARAVHELRAEFERLPINNAK